MANCHELTKFANIFPLQIFPAYGTLTHYFMLPLRGVAVYAGYYSVIISHNSYVAIIKNLSALRKALQKFYALYLLSDVCCSTFHRILLLIYLNVYKVIVGLHFIHQLFHCSMCTLELSDYHISIHYYVSLTLLMNKIDRFLDYLNNSKFHLSFELARI